MLMYITENTEILSAHGTTGDQRCMILLLSPFLWNYFWNPSILFHERKGIPATDHETLRIMNMREG